MVHGSHVQQASPLVVMLIGLFFAGIGTMRVYVGLRSSARENGSAEGVRASWRRRLGSSGVVGIGLAVFGLLVVLIGIDKLFT